MKPILILATAATFALASTCSAPAQAAPKVQAKTKAPARKTVVKKIIGNPIVPTRSSRVDIVFCIDCSGSMGPVIETAKQKIWSIVNQLARAKPSPALRIGLLGYGNADRTFRSFALSDDLDKVYENLMTFRDEGWSEEYVGLALHKADGEMKWGTAKQQLNVIYMVGNETARQGPQQFDYAKTTPTAHERDIVVNAIYCGSAGGEDTWKQMALLGGGQYLHIDQNGGSITVATPYDTKLAALSTELNKTYLPYGARGRDGISNQATQDSNSQRVGGTANAAARASAKSSAQYNSRGWDLVDAAREKGFDLATVKSEDLPANMRKMTLAQRKAHIAKSAQQRSAVQTQIRKLSEQREAYVQAEIKKRGLSQKNAFDESVRRSIVEQATAKGYRF